LSKCDAQRAPFGRLRASLDIAMQGIPQPRPFIMEIAWGQNRRKECETANE